MQLQLNPGFVVEKIGDNVLILDRTSRSVMSVPAALVEFREGPTPSLVVTPDGDVFARELIRRGVASEDSGAGHRRPTRRSVVTGGVTVAGAAMATLALPSIGHASSAPVPTRTGEWEWEPQSGSPPSSYNIYVYLSEANAEEVSLATWSYDAGRWTIDLDLDGDIRTATEYDPPPPEWEWYATGINSGAALTYLQAMDITNPYTLTGTLKENGTVIANLVLPYRQQLIIVPT
jgi:hypothetical protein